MVKTLVVPPFDGRLAADINGTFEDANELLRRAFAILASDSSSEGDKQRAQGIKDTIRILNWSLHPDLNPLMRRFFDEAGVTATERAFDEMGMPGMVTAPNAQNYLLDLASGIRDRGDKGPQQ